MSVLVNALIDRVETGNLCHSRRSEAIDVSSQRPGPLGIRVGCERRKSVLRIPHQLHGLRNHTREDSGGLHAPIMPLGATITSFHTLLIVPLMSSNAPPWVGVMGAGSSAVRGTIDARTTPLDDDDGSSK